MTNRENIINIIKDNSKGQFEQELNWYMELDREGAYDLADAFYDLWDFADNNDERKMKKLCHYIAIAAGYYIAAPVNTVELGEDTRITYNKVKYDCVTAWVLWIDK